MTLFLSALIAVCPLLQDVPEDIRPEKLREIQELQAEIKVLAVLKQAKISRDQAKEILKLIQEAADIYQETLEDHGNVMDDAVKIIKKYRTKVARGEEITAEDQTELDELEAALGDALAGLPEKLQPISERLREILEPDQLQVLMIGAGQDPFKDFRKQLRDGLGAIRQLSDDEFDIAVADNLEQRLTQLEQGFGQKLTDDEFNEEFDRIMEILESTRGMDDNEFKRKRGALTQKILGEGKLGEFAREATPTDGREARQALGKFLFNAITIRALKTLAGED